MLSEHPAIGKPVQVQARSIPLHDFPFDLVYRVFPDTLVIIALANQSRRPGYWVGGGRASESVDFFRAERFNRARFFVRRPL